MGGLAGQAARLIVVVDRYRPRAGNRGPDDIFDMVGVPR